MRRRWPLVAILWLGSALSVSAQERPDTLPGPLSARVIEPDSALRLGLEPMPLPFPIGLPPRRRFPVPLLRPRYTDRSTEWARTLRDSLAAARARLWLAARFPVTAERADTVAYLPPVEPEPADDTTSVLPGVAAEYADIGIAVDGRAEMGGVWTRFRPCDPTILVDCDPGLFPKIRPDVQFGVRVGGTIADRVHVDVDYDQRREFDAANNINVYYQGLEDEILQRIEVGDVSIALPSSRYLTAGIPAGNFGFKATGQIGPMDFQTVWAQQKGDVSTREFRLGGGASEGLVQELDLALDDADYAQGQFFFLVHPDSIAGTPYIDVLRLRPGDAPDALRPADDALEVYRTEPIDPRNLSLGHFLGHAVSADSSVTHSGQFRRLTPGEDYEVHSSGLWVVLRAPLRQDQILAASYVTEAGDTVGTLNADQREREGGETPTLRLLRGPVTDHYPGRPTWPFEMHQVYRLDASNDVDPGSIELDVSLGEASAGITYRDIGGRPIAFLQLFGLDEDSPTERIDPAQIYRPASDGFGDATSAGVAGTYIVFPALEPFARPPPGDRAGLTAVEAEAALGSDANAAIYDAEDPVERRSSARFRLNFHYRVRTEGLVSSFNLGAFGLREGSETVYVDGRPLERGRDYDIDYELGQVTLVDPQQIFAGNPDAEIRATYEQKAIFQVAPRNVFGAHTHWALGESGRLDLIGLYQSEKAFITRPQLGVEPGAVFLGGANARLDLDAGWLDRVVDAVPGLRAASGSAIGLEGELAMSMPNPNTRGATYLDDFESADEIRLSLARDAWRLGSAPGSPEGAVGVLPPALDASDAARIVWQEKYRADDGIVAAVHPRTIDEQIQVAGRSPSEPILYVNFGDSNETGDALRWRSVTTVLSTTGRDLTRSEYLEFYASAPDGRELTLVLDLGSVGEDAYYIAPDGAVQGQYPDGRTWGVGILDEEARLAEQELWGPARDALGLWNEPCTGHPTRAYALGDPAANCTVDNGRADTEDLDGDGVLDNAGQDGPYFRYVVPLGSSSPYLVRDRGETGTAFRLYRIPVRGARAVRVNGASDGTLRYIRHLRITVSGRPGDRTPISLSRMRIIGSRWTKREVHGILAGRTDRIAGTSSQTAAFRVGPVSQLTDGDVYVPPPGVRAEPQDPTAELTIGGREFNEKALRLEYEALAPDDRGEVYHRFPQQSRNLLSYRTLRLWALARAGRWGERGDQRLLVKVGTDGGNAYLYQTSLGEAADGSVDPSDWREVVIDFERWFALRVTAEQEIITRDAGGASTGGVEVWSPDSAYAVVLQDRAQAPNLAAVREVSFAVYNAGGTVADGELWIDDMRLTGAVTDPGYAGHVNLDVAAGDFANASLTLATSNPLFRGLDDDPSYMGTGALNVSGTTRLGRLLPAAWGVEVPVTVSHTRTGESPLFLRRSDIRADRLTGLRETGQTETRVGVVLAKQTPTANPWLSLLVDGTSLRLGYHTADRGGITARNTTEGFDGTLGYTRRLVPRSFDLTPGFVESFLRWITPGRIERSGAFRRLTDAALRWTPESFAVSAAYFHQESRSFRYDNILETPADSAVAPIVSPRERLENTARVSLRPLESLTADVSVTSNRDLLPASEATDQPDQREAIHAARSRLAGTDVGWETNRVVNTRVSFRPPVASWLRPGFTYSSRFDTDRNASGVTRRASGGDSALVLERSMRADRQVTRSLLFEPAGFAAAALGDSTRGNWLLRVLHALAGTVAPVDLVWTTGLNSEFERQAVEPGLGYQLGLGDTGRFRFVDGDTALYLLSRRSFQARSGLRLPWRLDLAVGYRTGDAVARSLRGGGRTRHERSWPDLRLGWSEIPLPGAVRSVISHASVSTGFVRTLQEGTVGAGAEHRARERTIPIQLTLGLAGGATASYNGSVTRGTSRDPTGNAERDAMNQAVGVQASFRAPGTLRESLRQPIQASLSYRQSTQRHCRFDTTGDDCVPFVDSVNRQLDLILDTMLSDLNVGLQMAYIDRQSYVGAHRGSSSFQLRFFGHFNFSTGTFGGAP